MDTHPETKIRGTGQSRPMSSSGQTSKIFYQTKLRYDKEPVKEGDMEVALEETLSRMESELQNIREEHPEDWFDEVPSLINIFNRSSICTRFFLDNKFYDVIKVAVLKKRVYILLTENTKMIHIELYKDSYCFFFVSRIFSGVQDVQRQNQLV